MAIHIVFVRKFFFHPDLLMWELYRQDQLVFSIQNTVCIMNLKAKLTYYIGDEHCAFCVSVCFVFSRTSEARHDRADQDTEKL